MVDFTVAIRTYNGGKRLPAILDRLQTQSKTEAIDWEVVIVDNNSTDDTAEVIRRYQDQWNRPYPLRYVFEPEQGAAIARRRSIQEARGTFIGFLDDDNVPDENWVAAAYTFGEAHPKAGAFGGQIHGDFEIPPPPNFKRIAPFIPVMERRSVICYTSYKYAYKKVLPPGAGLVIRRQVWLDHVPSRLVLQGPVGNSLAAKGEDIEALLYLTKAGWEVWNNPEMHIYHQIPKSRFEREYLLRFFQGVGLSRHRTRMLGVKHWQRPGAMVLYALKDSYKLVSHFLKYRESLDTDVVAACELELYRTSLLSPFHIWKNLSHKA